MDQWMDKASYSHNFSKHALTNSYFHKKKHYWPMDQWTDTPSYRDAWMHLFGWMNTPSLHDSNFTLHPYIILLILAMNRSRKNVLCTSEPTDGRTGGQAKPLIEMRGRIWKPWHCEWYRHWIKETWPNEKYFWWFKNINDMNCPLHMYSLLSTQSTHPKRNDEGTIKKEISLKSYLHFSWKLFLWRTFNCLNVTWRTCAKLEHQVREKQKIRMFWKKKKHQIKDK